MACCCCYTDMLAIRKAKKLRQLIKPMLLGCFVCNLCELMFCILYMHSFVEHWYIKCDAVKYWKSIKKKLGKMSYFIAITTIEKNQNETIQPTTPFAIMACTRTYMLLAQRFEFIHATLTSILEQSIFFFSCYSLHLCFILLAFPCFLS